MAISKLARLLGRYDSSSPSTKELRGLLNSDRGKLEASKLSFLSNLKAQKMATNKLNLLTTVSEGKKQQS